MPSSFALVASLCFPRAQQLGRIGHSFSEANLQVLKEETEGEREGAERDPKEGRKREGKGGRYHAMLFWKKLEAVCPCRTPMRVGTCHRSTRS